jgi:hypothetical protein
VQPTLEVANICRRHAAAYRAKQVSHLSDTRRRVMAAIEVCRGAALARLQWLADRQAERLAVPYFHVMFTNAERRSPPSPAEQGGRLRYGADNRRDPKHFGAKVCMIAALHTGDRACGITQNGLHRKHAMRLHAC